MLKQVWVCCPANTGNVNKYHPGFCLNTRLTIAKWFLRDILHVKLLFFLIAYIRHMTLINELEINIYFIRNMYFGVYQIPLKLYNKFQWK